MFAATTACVVLASFSMLATAAACIMLASSAILAAAVVAAISSVDDTGSGGNERHQPEYQCESGRGVL
jgi:hypothetical protein